MAVTGKFKLWLKRYIGAEIFGTLGAILGVAIASFFFGSEHLLLAAYAGTIGENVGFYGWMFFREHKALTEDEKNNPFFKKYYLLTKGLILEFGIAELLDSGIMRPACMYFAMSITGNQILGTAIGKILADVAFYVPAIICYELKCYLKKKKEDSLSK